MFIVVFLFQAEPAGRAGPQGDQGATGPVRLWGSFILTSFSGYIIILYYTLYDVVMFFFNVVINTFWKILSLATDYHSPSTSYN